MTEIAKHWLAYQRARDLGHLSFIRTAEKCENYFRGNQWDRTTLAKLGDRPALTVNMVLATMATAFGQMLENYTETMFFSKDPRMGDMNKVQQKIFRHVHTENNLRWQDMEMAMDGFITGRGIMDVRMSFDENMHGDVSIEHLDPRDVLIDPDARTYLPEGWKEVFISKWLSLDEITTMYGKAKSNKVRNTPTSSFETTHDVISDMTVGGTFAGEDGLVKAIMPSTAYDDTIPRRYRVVERQYKVLDRHEYFLDLDTGETREIPVTWDEGRVMDVVLNAKEAGANLTVFNRRAERIRIVVWAGNTILYDDWSPYAHYTVVPYFPYFRWGHTMGVVENILDLQDATNKTLSQTLHVINTTANSGWIIKAGALVNMTIEELEQRGAETGLVLEVSDMAGVDKISPNQIPTGLDRITNQLSDWVKYVVGISDSMRGFDRSDVAAKAIVAKQQAGAISLAIPFESLNRTRHYLAEVILGMVQRFYTEPRLMRVAPDALNGESEEVAINQPGSPASQILNDLTLGEYSVVVRSVPPQERQRENQYTRATELKKSGVPLPDWVMVEASGLSDQSRIMEDMTKIREAQGPMQQMEIQKLQAEVSKIMAEAKAKEAEAALLGARFQEVVTTSQGTNAKLVASNQNSQLQIGVQREKITRDDAYRYRKLLLDTAVKAEPTQSTQPVQE